MLAQRIAVIAPSFAPRREREDVITRIQQALQARGFEILFSPNFYEQGPFRAAPLEARLDDFHWAFETPDIDIVMPYTGGYLANQLLSRINWELIKANPRRFVGFSDITVLCNALSAVTGNPSYYGLNYLNFSQGRSLNEVSFTNFLSWVGEDSHTCQELFSETWYNTCRSTESISDTEELPLILHQGQAAGRTVGGNIGSLYLLQGTPWMPPLNEAYILLAEDDDLAGPDTLYEFTRRLESLLSQPGARQNLQALLIGRFQQAAEVSPQNLREALTTLQIQNIPIAANLNFGHTTPRAILPLGTHLQIELTRKIKINELA